ncbi:hypothetical protein AAVH_07903 [Aphelenchoides avenae]|nr:hypothetical protein AAVH_07903 [Aphelenchus avenae]
MEQEETDDVDSNPKELFFHVVKNSDTEQARKMLELQADLIDASDTDGQTPLHWACDAGHNEVVQLLVNSGADVNARDKDGLTPLHYAAMCSHPLTVRLLLDKGADPKIRDNDDQTPFDVAQFDENRELLAI